MGVQVEAFSSRTEGKKQSRFGYVQELKEELNKVTWTSKDELFLCTKIVVGSIFLFGVGTYFVDLGIKGVLDGIAALVHLIFG